MVHIAIHELRAGFSRYLARARSGEVIVVTSHGKPVARLVGVPFADTAGVARLLATGAAQWAGGKPTLRPGVELVGDGSALSEMVLEDRG